MKLFFPPILRAVIRGRPSGPDAPVIYLTRDRGSAGAATTDRPV